MLSGEIFALLTAVALKMLMPTAFKVALKRTASIPPSWKSRKGGRGNRPELRREWLSFHDHKWLNLKRQLTTFPMALIRLK